MLRVDRYRQFGLGQALTVLALLAVMLRVLVPGGFMIAPAKQDGGLVSIQLCSGHGAVSVLFDVKTGTFVEQETRDAPSKVPSFEAPCVFAAVAAIAPPVLAQSLAVLSVVSKSVVILFANVAIGQGLSAPPPWSTGPPVSL